MSAENATSIAASLPRPGDSSAREALDAMPVVTFTARDGGGIAWVSQRFFDLTGTRRDDDINAAWLDAIAPDDRNMALATWARARETGERYEATVRARMHDGTFRWFLSSAERLSAPDDMGATWFGTCTEITARRTAELAIEASERAYRALADAMPQIVWASSGEHNQYLNAQWFRYTGIDPTESSETGWSAALHPDDVEATFTLWRRCVASGEPFETEYRLRRADGVYRWFLGRGTPFADEATGGELKWFGTCTDIDDLRRRERAERFITGSIELLSRAREIGESCKLIATRAVETVATYCVVDLFRDNGRLERVAWAHADSRHELELAEVVNYPPAVDRAESPVGRALGRERVTFVPHFDDAWARRTAINDDHYRFLRDMRTSSLIAVPLEAFGRDIGAVTFCLAGTDEAYNDVDLAAFGDVGRRLGSAIESAQASLHDRTVANRFQRAALPRVLPNIEGITFDAVYHAAAGDAQVGGDWYDAVATKTGHVAISLGDVAGHDLDASIGMIGVRQAIRTAALFGHAPHDVLETVNAAMAGDNAGRFVTAFVAVLDVTSGTLRYASAGHPPALLRRADGRVERLASEAPPLGLFSDGERFGERCVELEPGDILVLYTDGLIESNRDVVRGEAELRDIVASDTFAHASSPAIQLRDRMLHGPASDDVAILVLGYALSERWTFEALDAVGAGGARVSFSRFIARTCTPDSDFVACELIFGELVGNVVRHAPGPVEIVVEWRGDRAMLHIYDRGPGLQWSGPSLPEAYAEGGRGLYIMSKLARSYDVEPGIGCGTHIAVELPVDRRYEPVEA